MNSDPVRAKRIVVQRWVHRAQRVGYLLFAAAIAAFVYGLIDGFTSGLTFVIAGALIAGSIVLAPAIVLGYGVRAAERDDRRRGR